MINFVNKAFTKVIKETLNSGGGVPPHPQPLPKVSVTFEGGDDLLVNGKASFVKQIDAYSNEGEYNLASVLPAPQVTVKSNKTSTHERDEDKWILSGTNNDGTYKESNFDGVVKVKGNPTLKAVSKLKPRSFNIKFVGTPDAKVDGQPNKTVSLTEASYDSGVDLSGLTFPEVTINPAKQATKERDGDKWNCEGAVTGEKTEAEIKGLTGIKGNITLIVVTKDK